MISKLVAGTATGVALIAGILSLASQFERKADAADTHQRIEKNVSQQAADSQKSTQRQLLEIRLKIHRLDLDRLRRIEHPTADDKLDIAYTEKQILALREQLESLDK